MFKRKGLNALSSLYLIKSKHNSCRYILEELEADVFLFGVKAPLRKWQGNKLVYDYCRLLSLMFGT